MLLFEFKALNNPLCGDLEKAEQVLIKKNDPLNKFGFDFLYMGEWDKSEGRPRSRGNMIS